MERKIVIVNGSKQIKQILAEGIGVIVCHSISGNYLWRLDTHKETNTVKLTLAEGKGEKVFYSIKEVIKFIRSEYLHKVYLAKPVNLDKLNELMRTSRLC